MKTFNLITLVLTIVAGLDMGLAGLLNTDFIGALFGLGGTVTRVVEMIMGLSALYQIYPLIQAFQMGEVRAEVMRS
jgi:uncharacterized protein